MNLFEKFRFLIRIFSICVLCSCSGVSVGGGGGGGAALLNDSRPSGTVISQGQFEAQNGNPTLTGQGIIFSSGASSYIARLEGITLTWQTGLLVQVFPSSGGTPAVSTALKGATGNQNYSFSSPIGSFSSLCIFSTQTNRNYGCAPLY